MSVDANEATVRRFFEEVRPVGDVAQVAALVAPDFVDHNPTPRPPAGTEGIRYVVRNPHGAHADLRTTIDDPIAEGDRVADRWTLRGARTGPLFGMPTSGERVENSTLDFLRPARRRSGGSAGIPS